MPTTWNSLAARLRASQHARPAGSTLVTRYLLKPNCHGSSLLAYYPTTGLGADSWQRNRCYTPQLGNNPVNEDYLLARLDQKLGAKDDFILRVVRDSGHLYDEPFPS